MCSMVSQGDTRFKIIIIGDCGTGKTALMNRFCRNCYSDEGKVTIGHNIISKSLQILNKKVTLDIWDTAGQERYFSLGKMYFRGCKGLLFVYDVTNPESLFNMEKWFKSFQDELYDERDIIKFLIGQKCDMNPKHISTIEGKTVADHYGLYFFETSAKENINVDQIFYTLASKLLVIHGNNSPPRPLNTINLEENDYHPLYLNYCFIYNWYMGVS